MCILYCILWGDAELQEAAYCKWLVTPLRGLNIGDLISVVGEMEMHLEAVISVCDSTVKLHLPQGFMPCFWPRMSCAMLLWSTVLWLHCLEWSSPFLPKDRARGLQG